MRTFDEVLELVNLAKEEAEKSEAARATAEADASVAIAAAESATLSRQRAIEAHASLVAAAKAVNDALAEIVAGDVLTQQFVIRNGSRLAVR